MTDVTIVNHLPALRPGKSVGKFRTLEAPPSKPTYDQHFHHHPDNPHPVGSALADAWHAGHAHAHRTMGTSGGRHDDDDRHRAHHDDDDDLHVHHGGVHHHHADDDPDDDDAHRGPHGLHTDSRRTTDRPPAHLGLGATLAGCNAFMKAHWRRTK
jgi:hypothetical protein